MKCTKCGLFFKKLTGEELAKKKEYSFEMFCKTTG